MTFRHAAGAFEEDRCLVMGIVNRTPDSFYGAARMGLSESFEYALELVAAGADILDVGGVKGGPGEEVAPGEEIDRAVPLVETLARTTDVPISLETARAEVARPGLAAGAVMINDVTGLADARLATVCAEHGAALVLMHHGGQIRGRPRNPRYADVVADVRRTLEKLVERAEQAGVERDRLVLDPGLDFGKTTWHSLELVRRLRELTAMGLPVLVAPSRKDVVGETLALPPEERLEGTLALVALAVLEGAAVVRVHDVGAAVRTVAMVEAVMGRRAPRAPVRGLWE